jgi:hypothetical protein
MPSGIYQLQSHTCNLSYIGQTGRRLEQRYKERIRYINSNNRQSAYAPQILHNQHDYVPMNVTMSTEIDDWAH